MSACSSTRRRLGVVLLALLASAGSASAQTTIALPLIPPISSGGGGGSIGGSAASGRIAVGTGADTLGSSANLLGDLDGNLTALGKIQVGEFAGENDGEGLTVSSLAEGILSPLFYGDTILASGIFFEADYSNDFTTLGDVTGTSIYMQVDSTADATDGAQTSSIESFLWSKAEGTHDLYQLNGTYQQVLHRGQGSMFSILGYNGQVQAAQGGRVENLWGVYMGYGAFDAEVGIAIGAEFQPFVDSATIDELYDLVLDDTSGTATTAKNLWSKGATAHNTIEGLLELTAIPAAEDQFYGLVVNDEGTVSNASAGAVTFPQGLTASNNLIANDTLYAAGTVKMPSLPTSDPHEGGQLWSDSGVVTVSGGD